MRDFERALIKFYEESNKGGISSGYCVSYLLIGSCESSGCDYFRSYYPCTLCTDIIRRLV
jgi:hypothetical protein